MRRRVFIKSSMAGAVAAALLRAKDVLAEWPKAMFEAEDLTAALGETGKGEVSDLINLKVPEVAENGAVVPVTIDASKIDGVKNISLAIDVNTTPVAATFNIVDGTEAIVSTRIKMAKTGNVIAIVKAGDKTYHAQQEVKVTIGGCGG